MELEKKWQDKDKFGFVDKSVMWKVDLCKCTGRVQGERILNLKLSFSIGASTLTLKAIGSTPHFFDADKVYNYIYRHKYPKDAWVSIFVPGLRKFFGEQYKKYEKDKYKVFVKDTVSAKMPEWIDAIQKCFPQQKQLANLTEYALDGEITIYDMVRLKVHEYVNMINDGFLYAPIYCYYHEENSVGKWSETHYIHFTWNENKGAFWDNQYQRTLRGEVKKYKEASACE